MRIINHSLIMMENRALRDKLDKPETEQNCVTLPGITLKCAFYLIISIVSALVAFFWVQNANAEQLIKGSAYIIIGIAVSAIPLFIFSIIMFFSPNSVIVFGPLFSVFAGLTLGFVAGLFELIITGIAFICIVASTTACFAVIFLDSLFKKTIKNGFLRFFPTFLLTLAAILVVLIVVSLTVDRYAVLFDKGFIILTAIFSIIPTLLSTVLLMFHMSVIYKLIEYKSDKKYEWFLAYSLSQLFVMIYGLIFKMIIVALSSAKSIKR